MRLIYGEGRKTDKIDAEKLARLARLARLDPKLLSPIHHRGENSQAHMALLRSRDALVGARTKLVNHVRGAVKSFGGRLPKCTAETFHKKVAEHLPGELTSALEPILKTIASLTERIKDYNGKFYPGRIPSSTEPPSTGSSRVRIETKREGALADLELPLSLSLSLSEGHHVGP